jgi:pimeloyl-ACP methyl ester carboxylesterase
MNSVIRISGYYPAQSMDVEELRLTAGQETLAATRIIAAPGAQPTVISFHGTGTTTHRGRIRYVLDDLATRGVSSACFDFSGHGESTGAAGLDAADPYSRVEEAFTAATLLCPPAPRAIIGTSMGAQLAALLLPRLGPRGVPRFLGSSVARLSPRDRGPEEPRNPRALIFFSPTAVEWGLLNAFDGKLLIIAGREDASIDLRGAPAASSKVIWLECGHFVHPWLAEHERERAEVLDAVLDTIGRVIC